MSSFAESNPDMSTLPTKPYAVGDLFEKRHMRKKILEVRKSGTVVFDAIYRNDSGDWGKPRSKGFWTKKQFDAWVNGATLVE